MIASIPSSCSIFTVMSAVRNSPPKNAMVLFVIYILASRFARVHCAHSHLRLPHLFYKDSQCFPGLLPSRECLVEVERVDEHIHEPQEVCA